MSTKLFVYGTLRRGGKLHMHMRGARYIKDIDIHFYKLVMHPHQWFPAMVRAPVHSTVKGEVYEVDDDMLERLKIVEGHPHLFKLTEVGVSDLSLGTVYAFVAEHPQYYTDEVKKIPKGDWNDFELNR